MTVELRARKDQPDCAAVDYKDHECSLVKEYNADNLVDDPGTEHYYQ